jgi:uncharacterized protein YjaG (DUF416 family)
MFKRLSNEREWQKKIYNCHMSPICERMNTNYNLTLMEVRVVDDCK